MSNIYEEISSLVGTVPEGMEPIVITGTFIVILFFTYEWFNIIHALFKGGRGL